MIEPEFGVKKWVRTKGSKNCAKFWSYTYTDDEGNHHGEWLICPMRVGIEMTWKTKKFQIKDTHSWLTLKNTKLF
jgi:hypothetical protein